MEQTNKNESRQIELTNKLSCNLTTVKNKCKDMQNVEWKHLLSTEPKLKTYIKFKENICTEDYVKHYTSRRKRY